MVGCAGWSPDSQAKAFGASQSIQVSIKSRAHSVSIESRPLVASRRASTSPNPIYQHRLRIIKSAASRKSHRRLCSLLQSVLACWTLHPSVLPSGWHMLPRTHRSSSITGRLASMSTAVEEAPPSRPSIGASNGGWVLTALCMRWESRGRDVCLNCPIISRWTHRLGRRRGAGPAQPPGAALEPSEQQRGR